MTGRVLNHHIHLDVVYILSGNRRESVQMVIDTGYVGTLSLPPKIVQAFGLPFVRSMSASLADGSHITIDVHQATIVWHGIERHTEVVVLDDRPLIGMVILDGRNMNVDLKDGGTVVLSEIP